MKTLKDKHVQLFFFLGYRSTVSPTLKTTRKTPSPERGSPDRYMDSPSRLSNRTPIDDYSRRRDDFDDRSQSSRKSISDRLTQLSKKFSNDSIDRKSDFRDTKTDTQYSTYVR